MISNGLKIKIKGIPFKKDDFTEFPLLKKNPKNKKQSTIIYGRNGTGKTSISNAINELKIDLTKRSFISEFVDVDNTNLYFDFSKQIYVFNEKFIDNKIRFSTTDGLNTIVLLGDELINADEIRALETLIDLKRRELRAIDLSVYKDKNNNSNPICIMNKIINTLKMDGNWASRQQKINRSSRKAAVNEQTVNNIAKSHSKKITIDEYNRLLEQFLKIDKTDEKYNEYFPCPIQKFDKNVFDDLMDKKLEMISNDVMARRILTTIEDYSENRINEIVVTLDSDLEYCPYCFRSINNTEKQSIIDRIKSVLSKESDAFINDLEKLKLMPYIIKSLPDFVDDLIRSKYVLACEHYNKTVDKINGFIEKKKVNLYSSLSTTLSKDYFLVYQNIESVIGEINTMILLHNTSIDKYEEMQNDLKEYCNYLSWETIKDLYNDYLDKKNKMTEISKRHLYLENEILILNEKLDDLNSKKKNVKDASTEINKSLAFIFLDNNRLSLRLHNDHYIVLSNGQQVPLDKLW